MIRTRILDSSAIPQGYLLQLQFDRKDIRFTPEQLISDIRASLADKIAALLFEKIEPKILEILENNNG